MILFIKNPYSSQRTTSQQDESRSEPKDLEAKGLFGSMVSC